MIAGSSGGPSPAACPPTAEHCITCGDEGTPMRVVSVVGTTAVCADGEQAFHDVAVDFVGPVGAGDEVLVHAGVAIQHRRPTG
ncbi:MAG TPA: HypC/HybG/HupF family hydrogenase formation chaperone [Solirubrobacteraceae bacterium]